AAGCELFHAADGRAFASVAVDGGDRVEPHTETMPVRGGDFRSWLTRAFFRLTGKPPGSKALQDVLGVLEARARFDGGRRDVFCRAGAGEGGDIHLDLGPPQWESVTITRSGWEVGDASAAVKFRRTRTMLALPPPVRGGSIEELRPFVNVGNDELTPRRWRLL